jgi:hypothetical protein
MFRIADLSLLGYRTGYVPAMQGKNAVDDVH